MPPANFPTLELSILSTAAGRCPEVIVEGGQKIELHEVEAVAKRLAGWRRRRHLTAPGNGLDVGDSLDLKPIRVDIADDPAQEPIEVNRSCGVVRGQGVD